MLRCRQLQCQITGLEAHQLCSVSLIWAVPNLRIRRGQTYQQQRCSVQAQSPEKPEVESIVLGRCRPHRRRIINYLSLSIPLPSVALFITTSWYLSHLISLSSLCALGSWSCFTASAALDTGSPATTRGGAVGDRGTGGKNSDSICDARALDVEMPWH